MAFYCPSRVAAKVRYDFTNKEPSRFLKGFFADKAELISSVLFAVPGGPTFVISRPMLIKIAMDCGIDLQRVKNGAWTMIASREDLACFVSDMLAQYSLCCPVALIKFVLK